MNRLYNGTVRTRSIISALWGGGVISNCSWQRIITKMPEKLKLWFVFLVNEGYILPGSDVVLIANLLPALRRSLPPS